MTNAGKQRIIRLREQGLGYAQIANRMGLSKSTVCYDESSVEAKHMVIARLMDRIEVSKGYEVHIKLRVALEQLIGRIA